MFGRYLFIYLFWFCFPNRGTLTLAFSCPFSQGCSQGSTLSPLEKNIIYIYIYIYFKTYLFWLTSVFVAARRLSLAVVSEGYSLVAVYGLFIAVASLVARHGF